MVRDDRIPRAMEVIRLSNEKRVPHSERVITGDVREGGRPRHAAMNTDLVVGKHLVSKNRTKIGHKILLKIFNKTDFNLSKMR